MSNVHKYDGKLNGLFKAEKFYTIEDKEVLFAKLLEILSNDDAANTVQSITLDMRRINGKNYQKKNNIDSSDILADILTHKYEDLLFLLSEQLADSSILGLCDSGRVTRLLQIWIAQNNK